VSAHAQIEHGIAGQLAVAIVIVFIASRILTGRGAQLGAKTVARIHAVFGEQLEQMRRNGRYAIAAMNGDVAVGIGAAVVLAALQERRLKGGIGEAVLRLPAPRALVAFQTQLSALPAGLGHVAEITGRGVGGATADEEDVIIEVAAEQRRLPAPVRPSVPRLPSSQLCATTCLSGGSARKLLGRVHGACGSAQVSSTGVGVRVPWL